MVMGSLQQETEVVVIGGGPGGYVAAIRAADLGREVVLIEEREKLGGVCLLEGCIPSKSLIHAVEIAHAARWAEKIGLNYQRLSIDHEVLRGWTDSVVESLSNGVSGLLRRKGVEVLKGRARFRDSHTLAVEASDVSAIAFRHCIIATGSRIHELPADHEESVWSSAQALRLPEIPSRLLVVGGGYIGLEMGLVYAGLGSAVTVVELTPQLLQGADSDLVAVVLKNCDRRLNAVLLESSVERIESTTAGYAVRIRHRGRERTEEFDRILVATGRRPNTDNIGLDNTTVSVDASGRIEVDEACRTAEPDIFAVGDVVPGPMLAHKAMRQARVAAEIIAQRPSAFDNRAIPAVVFTQPEMAWTGLTEQEAAAQGRQVSVARFPLSALGRARTLGNTEGFVKIITEPGTDLVLGVGIVAPQASELIAEGTLAVEMGATLEDLMVTIHPHPTLSEALMEAAEAAAGMSVHVQ